MRASKIPKETSKLLGSISQPAATTRRVTRSSLSRFAYTNGSPAKEEEAKEMALGSDIEDAVTTIPRKRRRVAKSGSASSTPAHKIKTEEVETIAAVANTSPSKPARKTRKPARSVTNPATGDVTVSPPSDWEEMYNLVLEMRQPGGPASNAAVDTMGCARLADRKASKRDQRFQTLVALMLSSQTKDTTNAAAMKRLQTELPAHRSGAPSGLNLENILAVDPKLLNELIWTVGFHNTKTKYIKQAAEILRDKFDGDIPPTIAGLTSLPGVGPKMAHLCMSSAWGRTEGIGVDVHVHRITNLWGWNKTSTPEATRLALQAWLPKEKWHEINWLLVGFGQTVCAPVARKCGDCELGLRGLCKAAERGKVLEGRKRREELKAEETTVKEEAGLVIKEE